MTHQDIAVHFRGAILVDQNCRLQIPIYNTHWMVLKIKSIKIPSKFQKNHINFPCWILFFHPNILPFDQDHDLHPAADGALPALHSGLDGARGEGAGVVSTRPAGGGRAPVTGDGVDVAWRWLEKVFIGMY